MLQIINPSSPLTFLEQRLNHARSHPEREWISFVENVPDWPGGVPEFNRTVPARIEKYESCQGDLSLREALCRREAKMNKISIETSNLLITNGALHGLSLVIKHFAQPGAVALCQSPPYTCVDRLLRTAGFDVRYFSGFGSNCDDLSKVLNALPTAKLIYINSPHNPTGVVLKEDYLKVLTEYCATNKIILVADQVYDCFPIKIPSIPAALYYSSDWDYVLSINSFSKNYGMPGLRVGWITSSKKNIQNLTGLLEMDCVSVCGAAQDYALQALNLDNKRLIEAVQSREKVMAEQLKNIGGLEYNEPEGGLQYFVKLPVNDVEEFADFVMLNYGVVMATGANFANSQGPYVRLSYAYSEEKIRRVLEILKEALNQFKLR